MKSSHIKFEQLVDLSENRVPAERRAGMLAHAHDCDFCAKELARVHQVINLMRADTTTDAPRDVLAHAVNLFRPQTANAAAKPSLVQRVLAALTFDSAKAAPAYGLRSGAITAATRQLLYTAGENDLDLRLAQSGATSWIVSGQVLGECATGGQVELRDASDKVAAGASLNDTCEFVLPTIAAGNYSLRVRFAETEIEVTEIELKA